MTIRTRILLVYLLLVGGGLYYLLNWMLGGVRPRYLESMEESLVDSANLLATVVETKAVIAGEIDPRILRESLAPAYARQLDAAVYSIHKTNIDLRIYVTDQSGRVIYDSSGSNEEGKDYSHWNDVRRTLEGFYGARATRTDPKDESSLVIHVAAPIRSDGKIIGVLALGKPTKNINDLVAAAKRRIVWAGVIAGGLIVAGGFAFAVWLATPIERLTAYARDVRDGKPATLPRLAGREVGHLRRAFEEMRDALEGKQYIERYTQALTHEIKAPLSAIRGAAELLVEEMPAAERARFLANIKNESNRIQQIVDQLLQLAALEARKGLGPVEHFFLHALLAEVVSTFDPAVEARVLTIVSRVPANLQVRGEKFLVRVALTNLLKNAVEFSSVGGEIEIGASIEAEGCVVTVADRGAGIPDFATSRIFERFYSLPRPEGGAKSTGLGLSFVQEIAHLHEGRVTVANRSGGGCRAEFWLPE